jgi:hypothetical protein
MSLLKSRRFMFAAVAIIVLGLGTVGVVRALPATGFTKYWYSDPDFQNWVGEDTLLCDGTRIRDGQLAGYSLTVVTENCAVTQFTYRCYADANRDRVLEAVACPW